MASKAKVTLIAAVANHGVIGVGNTIPWHIKADLFFFKNYTIGKPVIMGKNTWQSLTKKPLPKRPNFIVTRDRNYYVTGATVFYDLVKAMAMLIVQEEEICVIGGAEIYQQTLTLATDLLITQVALTVDNGDRFFPKIEENTWRVVKQLQLAREEGEPLAQIMHYQRIST